jgi:hypothetical protein
MNHSSSLRSCNFRLQSPALGRNPVPLGRIAIDLGRDLHQVAARDRHRGDGVGSGHGGTALPFTVLSVEPF